MMQSLHAHGSKSLFRSQSLMVGTRSNRQYQMVPTLHPFSPFRLLWVWLTLVVMASDVAMISLDIFDFHNKTLVLSAEWTSAVFWMLDIFMTFMTGVFVKGKLESQVRVIALAYAR